MSTPAPWQKILVAVDFSPHSLKAVHEARRLQHLTQAEVILLHVTQPAFDGLRIHTGDVHSQAQTAARDQLTVLMAETFPGSTSVSIVVKDGRPGDAISELARLVAADVILIGTHGISALEHFMLGSVVEKVVRHAPCSVLVVR